MINGIWDNEYVQMLGILDHCRETQVLYDTLRIEKARGHQLLPTGQALAREMMDLHLILERWAQNHSELKEERQARFAEKARE